MLLRIMSLGVCMGLLVLHSACQDDEARSPGADTGASVDANTDAAPDDADTGDDAADADAMDAAADLQSDGQADDVVDALPLEGFCAALAQTHCDEVASCECPNEGAEPEACLAAQRQGCERAFAGFISGVTLGRLTFDSSEAERCVADYAAAVSGCADPFDTPFSPACARMFQDSAPVGGRCAALNTGASCGALSGVCLEDRTCAPLPSEGQPCLLGRCANDLFCNAGVCGSERGTPERAEGEACSLNQECQAGLACTDGLCAPAPAIGAACTESPQCGRDATCLLSSARICAPLAELDEPCFSGECAPGLACEIVNDLPICRPEVPQGEPCTPFQTCEAGSVCNAGTCAPLPGRDEVCLFGQCGSGLLCNAATQRCGDLALEGETCNATSECAAGLGCDARDFPSVCRTKLPEGGDCGFLDDLCEPGLWCDSDTQRCAPLLDPGAACVSASACGAQAECVFPPDGSAPGACAPLATEVGAACGFVCGASLRCVQRPGSCVPGICGTL